MRQPPRRTGQKTTDLSSEGPCLNCHSYRSISSRACSLQRSVILHIKEVNQGLEQGCIMTEIISTLQAASCTCLKRSHVSFNRSSKTRDSSKASKASKASKTSISSSTTSHLQPSRIT